MLGQLDENSLRRAGMKKSDSLAFGAEPWSFVYQPNSSGPAFLQCCTDVVHCEADVVDSRSTLREEFPDRRAFVLRFEKLDQRVAGGHGGNACSV